ncbi:MAG TPA: RidA family protein [Polyangiales bacterium]|nr:RidA family protein [Polyangiales bacterium]
MTQPRRLISSGSPYEPQIGFSRAVRVGDQVYVAGTAPVGAETSEVAGQAERCLQIIGEALQSAGSSLADVVRTRVFLTRIEDWPAVARVHGQVFGLIRPACTVMQVSCFIDARWRLEIEVDAVVAGSGGTR